jgi:hypothetical protein
MASPSSGATKKQFLTSSPKYDMHYFGRQNEHFHPTAHLKTPDGDHQRRLPDNTIYAFNRVFGAGGWTSLKAMSMMVLEFLPPLLHAVVSQSAISTTLREM